MKGKQRRGYEGEKKKRKGTKESKKQINKEMTQGINK